jgi:hypothetical protein
MSLRGGGPGGATGALGGSGGAVTTAAGGGGGGAGVSMCRSGTGGAAGSFTSTFGLSGGVIRRGAGLGSSTGAAGGTATAFSAGASSTGATGGLWGGATGVVTADLGMASPAFGGMLLTAGGAALAIAGRSGSGAPGFLSAFSTSPGLEILEKSNFGPMSSALADLFSGAPLPVPRRCLRTRAASSSSRELECVFFSVTPTSGNTSRIALLLTSSSLAKSLIRTFDIR